ncbi:MAG: ParA family protein, partial [bacterium]|nr:ParA family protein [bacterium]
MPAKIICMASAKGGSGKTMLTATFGAFLSALGKKVLLIDTDAATNGLTLLYLKEVLTQGELAIAANRKPIGIFDAFDKNEFDTQSDIVKLSNGVHLIPATYKFKNTENTALNKFSSFLSSNLVILRGTYHYIFLDAQSGSDLFAQVCMSKNISDEVVIVSEYDPMSAAGVERLKGLLHEDLTYVRTWVLLNKMLPDFVKSFSDFLEVAKYLNPIPWDADVVKAYARRRLAIDLENGNEHTLAVMQTIKTLFGESIIQEIETWIKGRVAAIRQPIEDQYNDLEN